MTAKRGVACPCLISLTGMYTLIYICVWGLLVREFVCVYLKYVWDKLFMNYEVMCMQNIDLDLCIKRPKGSQVIGD